MIAMLYNEFDLANNTQHQLITFTALIILWSIIFTTVNFSFSFKSLSPKKSDDTKNRIVSIIHGLVSLVLSATQFIPYAIHDMPNTSFQNLIALISLSYCVYDLLACTYYKISGISLVIHHLCCIVGFGCGVYYGFGVIDGIGGLLAGEVSNFPMHLRVILRNFHLKYTKSYEISENIYLFLYIIARGIFLTFMVVYPCMISEYSPLTVKVMCAALTIQSYHFIYQMIGIIQKKIQRYQEMNQKNIQFQWLQENQSELKKLSFYQKREADKIF